MPAPGMAPSLPGASGVVAALGASTSPAAPLTAATVPSAGARSTVSSTSFCAAATAACATATSPRCWAISDGRSVRAESRLFCAVTRPCRAFATWTRPAASSTSTRLRAVSSAVLLASTWRSAWVSADCAVAAWVHAEFAPAADDDTSEPARLPAARSAASRRFRRSSADSSSESESESSSESPSTDDSRPEVSIDALEGVPPDASQASSRLVELVFDVVAGVLVEVELLLRAVHRGLVGRHRRVGLALGRVDDLARLVRGVLRARHGGGVDQPVQRGLLGGELALLLLEHAPQCGVVDRREDVALGDLLADRDLDGLELAALEEAQVLLGHRRQGARRRDRGAHARALDADGRRGRRTRRRRAGDEGGRDQRGGPDGPGDAADRHPPRAQGAAVPGAGRGDGGSGAHSGRRLRGRRRRRPWARRPPGRPPPAGRPARGRSPAQGTTARGSRARGDPPRVTRGGFPDDGGWGPATLRHPMGGTYKRRRGPAITGSARDVPVTRVDQPVCVSRCRPWIASV